MPRGYRYIVLATLGCLIPLGISFALSWSLYPKQISLSGNTAIETISAQERKERRECSPTEIGVFTGPAREAKREACERSASEHQDQRNSYIQSRRSADASDAQAFYALEQARVAAVGAGLGLVTLIAAVVAAVFAGLAAMFTSNANKIAKENSQRENRPYIFTIHTGIADVNGQRSWEFEVINHGITPAIVDVVEAVCCTGDAPPDLENRTAEHLGTDTIFVPNAGRHFSRAIPMSPISPQPMTWLLTRVAYRDHWDNTYFTYTQITYIEGKGTKYEGPHVNYRT